MVVCRPLGLNRSDTKKTCGGERNTPVECTVFSYSLTFPSPPRQCGITPGSVLDPLLFPFTTVHDHILSCQCRLTTAKGLYWLTSSSQIILDKML